MCRTFKRRTLDGGPSVGVQQSCVTHTLGPFQRIYNSMAETVSVKGKEPPPTYDGQPAPHMKHRYDKEQWREIERRNAQYSRTLRDIRREPPAVFHA